MRFSQPDIPTDTSEFLGYHDYEPGQHVYILAIRLL
jgi:hypothetical protein